MQYTCHFPWSDIDECVGDTAGCEHSCTNTNGSYYCSCNSGYVLVAGGHMCNGEEVFFYNIFATAKNTQIAIKLI